MVVIAQSTFFAIKILKLFFSTASNDLQKSTNVFFSIVISILSTSKPKNATLANSNTGIHTIKLTVRDRAGNYQNKTYNVYYDPTTNLPSLTTFSATGNSSASSGYTKQTNLSFAIDASDSLSGIRDYTILDGTTTIINK